MAPKVGDLRAMSDAELIAAHDRVAEQYPTTVNYFLDELRRRAADRQSRQMLVLTYVIAGLTVVNVASVIIAL